MAAKNYTEILALVNAGNQMGLSNTIKRDYGIPLDFTSVQPSYDDAVIYAAENTKAYVGQPLSVGGKLYIINDVAAETKHVVGDKEYDNYLVEVGSATEGDGVSIDLEAGVLTLHGFESALTGYLPRKSEDGELEWVPISAVVQGDGNKVTTLTSEDGSVTITKKTDTDESLVYDLSVESYDDTDVKDRLDVVETAIGVEAEGETEATGIYAKIAAAVQEAKDYADAQDTDTVYDDTVITERIETIEKDYLKKSDETIYDDSVLVGRVDVIERDYLKKSDETIYDDSELRGRVESLESAVEAIDYVDETELATALEPYAKSADVNTELAKKADKEAFETLKGRVDTFFEGTGVENVIDTLEDLIKYINEHDDLEVSGILSSIEAIEGKLEGVESTVVAYVTAAIEALKIGDYAKAADLTELAGRVEELEKKPFDTYATKTEVSDVDAKFANYTTTEVLNGELAKKADADKVVANDTFESFKATNTDAIATAKQEAIEAAAVAEEAKGYAVAEEVADTYATKQELTDYSNTVTTTLNDYAKTADVNVELAKKIESATISHSTAEKAEGVTKNGTQLDIVVDAYTKEETRNYVAEVIRDMTGGESAADVLRDLNAHIDTYTEKVGQIDAKDSAQDTAIATAQAQADKGVADAAKVAADLVTLSGTVGNNTSDISTVKARLETLETAKGDHETRIATAEGKITSLETVTGNNSTAIGLLQGKDAELVAEDAKLAGLITALDSGKANAADVYTKAEVYTKDEVDAVVQGAIDTVDFTPYAKTEDVNAAISDINAAILETNTEVAKKANAADVYTKGDADAKFLTETQVKDVINKVVADVSNTDTIEGLVTLVEYVHDNAGDIAKLVSDVENNGKAIAKNAEDITTNKTNIEQNASNIAELTATVAAQKVVASTEVSVTAVETGVELGIKEVNVNKLVQTEGELLVLNGGSAAN